MLRIRAFAAALACVATLLVVGAGSVAASSQPAVTGAASSVKSTLAQLNGTVYPDGLDAFWAFQYGTSASAYGEQSAAVGPLSGTDPVVVATLIRDLKPGTTYHFRLVAVRGEGGTSGDATGYTGADATFTTPGASSAGRAGGHARAVLRSRTLPVRRGATLIPWACAGARGAVCKGKASLTVRTRTSGRIETVKCGAGSFSVASGKHAAMRAVLGTRCLALVTTAAHHRLGASLTAAFGAGGGSLRTRVTLVLG
jgi:hypothetical protein